ncbi:tetraacyldisaccharide 4'-kinase [Aurantimonas sp. DM33-3]|uniref:tetraacyldisaccharide 4'-kinase n=1 Tax=Aurantimonas sp. DM33-3 TaxID=2766955 RepID=UPI001651D519|nr:tetraacyldisaccharide 4'-kinase [Aurantimonas sp. DM33-3]MBC6718052.1 tetraacyldisaccharide 4'-kinase [Aurantimonas sp. DM33-3]
MMRAETPPFWWRPKAWQSLMLAPAAAVYGRVARRNLEHGERADVGVPVLCVGNFTVGGGGKTPTAMALGRAALAEGLRPGFVSRGHGRASRGAVLVDPAHHSAAEVGDEPLLLASVAPTCVAVNRRQAAQKLLAELGVDFIIMDDGFQSARLAIDFALIAVDARRGLGNGAVVPAGPVRAPLIDQIRYADALLVIGEGSAGDAVIRQTARGNKPIFEAALEPENGARFAGLRVLAFAGIADPAKFYASLTALGAEIVETRDFPDHHVFSSDDMDDLSASAWREGLQMVTTRKDAVRLATGSAAMQLFLKECEVLDVALGFAPQSLGARIIRDTRRAFRRRKFG